MLVLGLLTLVIVTACGKGENPTTEGNSPSPFAVDEDRAPQRWFTDEDKSTISGQNTDGDWIAAWFGTSGTNPEEVRRYWRKDSRAPTLDAPGKMKLAVEWLNNPPAGANSAFTRGLQIIGVKEDGSEVLLDIEQSSPGLGGHSTNGLILGAAQLVAVAAYYFPNAKTLCVAFDGRRLM